MSGSTVYVDTGVMAKLYCFEPDSARASELIRLFTPPFPFSHWQEIELRNALRLKVFRKDITARELRAALQNLQNDIENGVWERPVCDPLTTFHEAERLSAAHAAAFGCRTLDILHVAVAVIIQADEFVTGDTRQAALAGKIGLRVRLYSSRTGGHISDTGT